MSQPAKREKPKPWAARIASTVTSWMSWAERTREEWNPVTVARQKAWRALWVWLGPIAISADWMFWGILHFRAAEEGLKQMPLYLPFRAEIFAAAGVAEIILAIAMWTRWRKHALLATCVLLVLFLPAVVHMLVNDDAMSTLSWPREMANKRVFLVLHNALMLLWAYALFDNLKSAGAKSSTESPAGTDQASTGAHNGRGSHTAAIVVAIIMMLANLAGLWAIARGPWFRATPSLWAVAWLACGALVGFLFGIPKLATAPPSGAAEPAATRPAVRLRPNTNIEELSDWLTKMIVGVGLVQLHQVGPVLDSLGTTIAAGFQVRDPATYPSPEGYAESFAKALILYFSIAGLLQGYLLTRLFLTTAFAGNDAGATGANATHAASGTATPSEAAPSRATP